MGSVSPKDGKPRSRCRYWQLAVSVGRDPVTGKNRRKTRRFHGSYREAMAELARFESTVAVPKGHMRLSQAADAWIAQQLAYGTITEATAAKKRQQLRNVTVPLGEADVDQVTTRDLQRAFDAMLEGRGPSGHVCGRTYVGMVQQTVTALFDWCVRQEAATSNPCRAVARTRPDTTERRALTRQEADALVRTCLPLDRHTAGLMLALLGGLRRAECCGLEWADVDLLGRTMRVRGTKTEASDAVVPVCHRLANMLSPMPRKGATVMAGDDGEPMDPHAFSQWWRMRRGSFGLDGVTIHDLRHTFATRLAEDGVHPSVMAKLVRHSDPRTTLEIYTHVQTEDLSWAVDGM